MTHYEEEYQDYGLYDPMYSKDPFREDFFIFDHFEKPSPQVQSEASSKESHFVLEEAKTKPEVTKEEAEEDPKNTPVLREEPTVEEKKFKSIFVNAGKQIIAGAVIFAVGFLALNWSAYYQIAKNYWDKYFGNNNSSILNELASTSSPKSGDVKLASSSDPDVLKRQIPDLELEVMPLDTRLIIPRIDKNIPIVRVSSEKLLKRDWDGLEAEMQTALRDGVVHYPGTSLPGETGNTVITGHSSYFPWDPGRFKDVFALLHEVVVGDKIVIYHNQKKYTYKVTEIKVVAASNIEVLKQTPSERLTLITCTPVGTNLRRLIVIAEPEKNPSQVANKIAR